MATDKYVAVIPRGLTAALSMRVRLALRLGCLCAESASRLSRYAMMACAHRMAPANTPFNACLRRGYTVTLASPGRPRSVASAHVTGLVVMPRAALSRDTLRSYTLEARRAAFKTHSLTACCGVVGVRSQDSGRTGPTHAAPQPWLRLVRRARFGCH
jgi:hypothetical protein